MRSSAGNRAGLWAVFAAFALSPAFARATVVVPQDVPTMARKADWIVRGTVRNQYADWDREHRRIYTFTEIEVLETLHRRAAVRQGDGLVVRTLGGEVGEIGMRVSGTARFAPGEEVMLFVRASERVQGTFHVVGMSQGKFTVDRSEGPAPQVVPGASGLAYARRKPAHGTALDHHSPLQRMSLEAFRRQVQAALSVDQGRPTSPSRPDFRDADPTTAPNRTSDGP